MAASNQTGVAKNSFKVLEVDDAEEEEVANVRQVENSEDAAGAACGFEGGKAKKGAVREFGEPGGGLGEAWSR